MKKILSALVAVATIIATPAVAQSGQLSLFGGVAATQGTAVRPLAGAAVDLIGKSGFTLQAEVTAEGLNSGQTTTYPGRVRLGWTVPVGAVSFVAAGGYVRSDVAELIGGEPRTGANGITALVGTKVKLTKNTSLRVDGTADRFETDGVSQVIWGARAGLSLGL